MIDVSQVSLALRRATARSLLIIDEFGKGAYDWLLFEGMPITSVLHVLGARYQSSGWRGPTCRMHQEPGGEG